MRTRWHTGRLLRVVAAPLLLGGVLTGLGSTAASASALGCQAWTGGQPANPEDTGSGDTLSGVAVINACNVWAVGGTGGRNTLIEHWTGGSNWTVVPSPSPGEGFSGLASVSGKSPTDIWAVGTDSNADGSVERSLILHWNGTSWTQVLSPSPGTFNQLTSVREISANDAWAVGNVSNGNGFQSLTLHWDGTSWTQVASPSPGGPFNTFLTGVTATSGGDVWAVGDYISSQDPSVTLLSLILHWDGTSWKQVASPSPGPVGLTQLTSVAATSPTNAWAVGFFPDGTSDRNLILHWDGTNWSQAPSPNPLFDNQLDGVAATSANSAVAVGTGQAAPRGAVTQAVTLRWDGTSWTPAPSLQKNTAITLTGVDAISATETWAVGFFGPTPTQTLAFHLK